MKLDFFALNCHGETSENIIRPAGKTRTWMDQTPQRFVYRCLPLVVANQHGWELFCAEDVDVGWNGGPEPSDVTSSNPSIANGHFGSGILTFHVGHIVRTEPEYDLYVQGPVNEPRDGISPLTGIVETDWNHTTFTMNWKFTRPCELRFNKGETFATIFPIKRGLIEEFEPTRYNIQDDVELNAKYLHWSGERESWLKELPVRGSKANTEGWQKDYTRNARKTRVKLK